MSHSQDHPPLDIYICSSAGVDCSNATNLSDLPVSPLPGDNTKIVVKDEIIILNYGEPPEVYVSVAFRSKGGFTRVGLNSIVDAFVSAIREAKRCTCKDGQVNIYTIDVDMEF